MEKADKKADYAYTPLHRAVAKGDVEAMKRLLEEKGIDVNVKNMFGSTALHLAVGKGDVVLVQLAVVPKIAQFLSPCNFFYLNSIALSINFTRIGTQV